MDHRGRPRAPSANRRASPHGLHRRFAPTLPQNALGEKIRAENGVARAVEIIERHAAEFKDR